MTDEEKWMNRNCKVGKPKEKELNAMLARLSKSKKYIVVCVDCSWTPETESALEADVHTYLTGHTTQKILIRECKKSEHSN